MAIVNVDYSSLDFDEMAAAMGLKSKHMPILVGSYLDEAKRILLKIEVAVSENNYEDLKLQVHSLKGSSGNLKFNEIYEMTKEMEFAASKSNTSFEYVKYLEAIKSAIGTIPK